MVIDKLYELAFAYKKAKPWKSIDESQVFAVRLPDDQIGYISIMGEGGEFCALSLFVGEKGLKSLRVIQRAAWDEGSRFELQESMFMMDCLNCALECKDMLEKDEYEEAKEYARKHNMRISGKNAYPHFIKYNPGFMPWRVQSMEEQEQLCAAVEAAIEMTRLIKDNQVRLPMFWDEIKELPLMESVEGGFVLSNVKLPDETPMSFPKPELTNDICAAKLKKAKRSGIWECKTSYMNQPAQNSADDVPVFPLVLFALDTQNDKVLPVMTVFRYEENAGELLNDFAAALLEQNIRPKEIRVCEERTYALLQSFCKQLNIPLNMVERMEDMERYESDFIDDLEEYSDEDGLADSIIDLLSYLLQLDEAEFEKLTPDETNVLLGLKEDGLLPPEVVDKLNSVLEKGKEKNNSRIKRRNQPKSRSNKSYVISVSLTKGCYRHIQISSQSTLEGLSDTILDAFNFDNDHAHAFFMDNKKWSDWDCYYMEGVSYDDDRLTNEYTLGQVGLYEGMQFKYVFDFGDEWVFQCKVLKINDENIDRPAVIKKMGRAPRQY